MKLIDVIKATNELYNEDKELFESTDVAKLMEKLSQKIDEEEIVIANALTPSDTAQLHKKFV